jgi:glycosyltransferase involved in cell wall biosynthesis
MQGAQTESRFRGIGRYTMEFTQAVVRNRGEHEIILVLSGLFPNTIGPIRAAFEGLLPQENIRVWYAPGPVKEEQLGNDTRREVAELIREAFIASLNPDVVHITSLFEGYVDCAVTSIGRFNSKALVSVTLYDLIPLLNPEQYLQPNPRYQAYYQRKIDWLKKAAVMLGISDYACQEAKDALSIDSTKVVAISTAIESSFKKLDINNEQAANVLGKFGIKKPFLLYTGGADERKNLPRLIQAYAKLKQELRCEHQLVFAGRMPEGEVNNFSKIENENGLDDKDLIFTGYISEDDLVALYNLCKLYVFPSWHEGFGLPALEAMACGAPVIGANTTSLPEVIGLDDALFDPFDVASITQRMQLALTDENFRKTLIQHAKQQVKKFSWDKTATIAINSWEKIIAEKKDYVVSEQIEVRHQVLINQIANTIKADESLNLVKIAKHLAHNEGAGTQRQLLVDVSELCQNDAATGVQRVVRSYLHHLLLNPPENFTVYPVYATQTENYRYASQFLARLKGKDPEDFEDLSMRWQSGDIFYGLDMQHHVQLAHSAFYDQMRNDGVTVKFLVYDLLPIQLADLFKDDNAKELHEQLMSMIAQQNEAICISKATADAFENWLTTKRIKKNPQLKISWVHMGADLEGSKPSSGMPIDAKEVLEKLTTRPTFLSVSTLEPRKAQEQILDAIEKLWAEGVDVNLVLVGQQGWKVDALVNRINTHPENSKRLFWLKGISDEYLTLVYQNSTCLIAASINEGFGLPLIEAARHKIPVIARDIPVFREVAGDAAFYFSGNTGKELAESMKKWLQLYNTSTVPDSGLMHWNTWQQSAEQLKTVLTQENYAPKQLLVDVSELVQRDAKSGIQRVVRSILSEWLAKPNDCYRIEPVYATHDSEYRYAKRFMAGFIGSSCEGISDEPIEVRVGDVFLGLDLAPAVVPHKADYYKKLMRDGVKVIFVIYDLLPLMEGYFEPAHAEACIRWLDVATSGHAAICISQSVEDELREWLHKNRPLTYTKLDLCNFHLGADIAQSLPTLGLPTDASSILRIIEATDTFLMVSTLAPHKGHAQVLEAFDQLWAEGSEVMLVIVGKQGWMVDELVNRLRNHPENGKKLFWLEGISDEYLEKVYEVSTCLIAASYGEGFGLPLIEAAQHKIPIIARDIPVFREVAGEHAFYFDSKAPDGLAMAIQEWLELYRQQKHPLSDNMPWLTWEQSAKNLQNIILESVVTNA